MYQGQKAFTLIELLVVISIISLLSSVILAAFGDAREKARMARLIQFSASIQHANYHEVLGDWNFNMSSDLGIDASGNGNNGDDYGIYSSQGVRGGALDAGPDNYQSDSYVEVFDTIPNKLGNGSNTLTIEAWIKPSSNNVYMGILDKYDGYQIYLTSPGNACPSCLVFKIYDANSRYRCVGKQINLVTDIWHHIAGVYDSSRNLMKLFFDAEELKNPYTGCTTAITWAPIFTTTSSSLRLEIGDNSELGYSFAGLMDEVRIYKSSLGF